MNYGKRRFWWFWRRKYAAAYAAGSEECSRIWNRLSRSWAKCRLRSSAGGGMVSCTVTGLKEIVSIKINPSIVDAEDVEMLEDTVTAAVKEAMAKAEEIHSERMGRITGGMGGMF